MKKRYIFIVILIIFIITFCSKNKVESFTNFEKNKEKFNPTDVFKRDDVKYLKLIEVSKKIKEILLDNVIKTTFGINSNVKKIINTYVDFVGISVVSIFRLYFQNTICDNSKLSINNKGIQICKKDISSDCLMCKKFNVVDILKSYMKNKYNILHSFTYIELDKTELKDFKLAYIDYTQNENYYTKDNAYGKDRKLIYYNIDGENQYSVQPALFAGNIILKNKLPYLVKGIIFILRVMIELKWDIWNSKNSKYLSIFRIILCLPALRWTAISKKQFPNELKRLEKKLDLIVKFNKYLNIDNLLDKTEPIKIGSKTYDSERKLWDEICEYLLGQDFFSFGTIYIDPSIINPMTLYCLTKRIKRDKDTSDIEFYNGEKIDELFDVFPEGTNKSSLDFLLERIEPILKKKYTNYKNLKIYNSDGTLNTGTDSLIETVDIVDIESILNDILLEDAKDFTNGSMLLNVIGLSRNKLKGGDGSFNAVSNIISRKNIKDNITFRLFALQKYIIKNYIHNKDYKTDKTFGEEKTYDNLSTIDIYNELIHLSNNNKKQVNNFNDMISKFFKNEFKNIINEFKVLHKNIYNTQGIEDLSINSSDKVDYKDKWLKVTTDNNNELLKDIKCVKFLSAENKLTYSKNLKDCENENYYPYNRKGTFDSPGKCYEINQGTGKLTTEITDDCKDDDPKHYNACVVM